METQEKEEKQRRLKAVNNAVFIIRDEVSDEDGGLIIPSSGKEKPHTGKIYAVGSLVQDKRIREGKQALFHKGMGFVIPYEGVDYLVLQGSELIAVI